MSKIPEWLASWWRGWDTGTSSKTIAAVLSGNAAVLQIQRGLDAPHDTSDVGRCVRLLDLAEANGKRWRGRLADVAAVCPAWAPLVDRWPEIEAAYRDDEAAQRAHGAALYVGRTGRRLKCRRTDLPFPPSRCWWLVATLRERHDPYQHHTPHPFSPSP